MDDTTFRTTDLMLDFSDDEKVWMISAASSSGVPKTILDKKFSALEFDGPVMGRIGRSLLDGMSTNLHLKAEGDEVFECGVESDDQSGGNMLVCRQSFFKKAQCKTGGRPIEF